MPWGDSGIYGGYCTGLKPQIFAQNWGERGRFVKMMIIRSHRLSLYDFLWSSLCIYRKMMIIRSHEIGSLVTSYDHPYVYMYRKMMIIRSHNIGSLVISYDHHFIRFHKVGSSVTYYDDHFSKWWSLEATQ